MNLDDINHIKKLDKSNVYSSIINLANQCEHAYSQVRENQAFSTVTDIKNIVLSGMGGSGLAARVLKPLFKDKISVPVEMVNSYHLPNYVSDNSFVLVSSYSGNTEETLATAKEALTRKATIFTICAGGKLFDWSKSNNIPVYKIDPKYNPCGQPRMAIGYSIFGQLTMLIRAGILQIDEGLIKSVISFLKSTNSKYEYNIPEINNLAKKTAINLKDYIPVLVGSNHINGALHVTKNQLNENAKTFALLFTIPELNHHLMEGLQFPKSNKTNLYFLLYQSQLYSDQIQKRFQLTEKVVNKNKINTLIYNLNSDNKLTQVFEAIQFGAYWQFYLSMLNEIDPAPIPWVDYFKARL